MTSLPTAADLPVEADLPVAAVVVAAGRGARMLTATSKQFLGLAGRPVLAHCLGAFAARQPPMRLVIVRDPTEHERCEALAQAAGVPPERLIFCTGGTSRQQSVANGLERLAEDGFPGDGIVLIHDAARPFVPAGLIDRAVAAAQASGAAVPVLPAADTMIMVTETGAIAEAIDRTALRSVQTPQAFRFALILDAHRAAAKADRTDFTDDAGIVRWTGGVVATFAGDASTFKLTFPADMERAEQMARAGLTDIRSATGYDVHAFGPGDHVMLGGVRIAHDHGLVGHSDADVALHALTDAILGALADGDIGQHFPPSDEKWRGAASHLFLRDAADRVRRRGGMIRHLDATIVCESPRIGPHRDAMRATIAEAAGISLDRVAIKATTSERLGFTGRREGIAALATATIALPE